MSVSINYEDCYKELEKQLRRKDIEAGTFQLDGELPVQPDGGGSVLDTPLVHQVSGCSMSSTSSFSAGPINAR